MVIPRINKQVFSEEAGEVIFKLFSDILSLVSGTYYPPRSKKIVNLISNIKKTNFLKSTLGGCVIQKKDGFISFTRLIKYRNIKNSPIT